MIWTPFLGQNKNEVFICQNYVMKKEIDIKLKYQIEEYYDNTPFIPLSKEKYVEYINGLIKKVQIKDNNDLIDKIKNYTLSL